MPVLAQNDVPVPAGATAYSPAFTWEWDQPTHKLTADLQGGALYLQVKDAIHGGYTAPELKLRPGFHSRTFATPIYGFRVRSAGTAATLDWSLYA